MPGDKRVRDIMSREVVRLAPDEPIRRAIARMLQSGATAGIAVESNGRPVGILTEKDCFRPTLHASYYQEWRGAVSDHMSPTPVFVDAGDDPVSAAEMFLAHPHRVFPVLEAGVLVGMLERRAVLSLLFENG